MAVLVEHEKRKHEILAKSMDLFIEEGYEAVTFQKIADRCGITRTTLYIYFKNKREIFIWSIKDLTSALEKRLVDILNDRSLTVLSCLETFMNAILDECVNNGKLFKILLIYLIQIQKTGENAEERITRRVIRVRHLLNVIIIRGQQSGEIRKDSVKDINDLLYSLLESAVFKLAVVGKNNIDDARRSISFTINLIRDA
ncbi:MAG: TetR/AcrR family transcriptional regulator [Treponema sp.]|nr:TetR/AcrR family transcriptional regulator [Treponema sp.]